MIVLGMHFGHDASVSLVRDGQVLAVLERERTIRIKHCIGLTHVEVQQVLAEADLTIDDVDFCAVTSTQRIEYVFPEPEQLSFKLQSRLATSHSDGEENEENYLKFLIENAPDHVYISRLSADIREALEQGKSLGSVEDFGPMEGLLGGESGLSSSGQTDYGAARATGETMYRPVDAVVLGRRIPGYLFAHHFAHAAYAHYSSPFSSSLIMTHDGSLPGAHGYLSGMVFHGDGMALRPIAGHWLSVANLYERVAVLLGLGYDTGAGKLMGLAPYGEPAFFDSRFVGNWHAGMSAPDYPRHPAMPSWLTEDWHPLNYRWVNHCLTTAQVKGYDLTHLGDPAMIMEEINRDIAASTQLLFEETMLAATDLALNEAKAVGLHSDGLCISGGAALNCPTNSRLYRNHRDLPIFVGPAVHDGGLSIGAALAVYHEIFGHSFTPQPPSLAANAFLGLTPRSNLGEAAKGFQSNVTFRNLEARTVAQKVAQMLVDDEIVGVFVGRSEIGPRALGHRSILANPLHKANWERVNVLKKREFWRPFAPAVLLSQSLTWFDGCQIPSEFMLFNAQNRSPATPATMHVDGSARIQTVDESDGLIFEILTRFFELTGVPLLMNTSFNGPGEPIIETAIEGLTFLIENPMLSAVVGDDGIATRVTG